MPNKTKKEKGNAVEVSFSLVINHSFKLVIQSSTLFIIVLGNVSAKYACQVRHKLTDDVVQMSPVT